MPDSACSSTLFRYRCSCGLSGVLENARTAVRCASCGRRYPLRGGQVIDFVEAKTAQNDYFDRLYETGHRDAFERATARKEPIRNDSVQRAERYLLRAGLDPESVPRNLSFLDAACGSGWVTEGLYSNPNIRDCAFHAFDISLAGLEILARSIDGMDTSNRLEMSVQNAEAMMFADESFDLVVGSSILHHFDEVQEFLKDCRRILKPGGVAIFGEPFAVGYGLGAAALKLAQDRLGTDHREIENLYSDIANRVQRRPEILRKLVDKHLFLHSELEAMARKSGFSQIEFFPLASREFYRERFIDELLAQHAVSDRPLADAAKAIYGEIFALFDAESYGSSVAAFIEVVVRR